MRLERVFVAEATSVGVFVAGAKASAKAGSLVVVGTRPRHSDLKFGWGMSVEHGGQATLQDVRLSAKLVAPMRAGQAGNSQGLIDALRGRSYYGTARPCRTSSQPNQTSACARQRSARVAAALAGDKGGKVSLVFAVPDHPWVESTDGAAVRVAMTVSQRCAKDASSEASEGTRLEVTSETLADKDAGGEVRVELAARRGVVHADLAVGATALLAA